MNMNDQLRELYKKYWNEIRDRIVICEQTACPYLLYASEKYQNAQKRVMLVGKETYGWYGAKDESNCYQEEIIKNTTVDDLMKLYNRFVNQEQGNNKCFWSFCKPIIEKNPSIGFIANNIVKIGKRDDAGYYKRIDKDVRRLLPFKEEIKILKPNLIFFFTGKDYDDRIRDNLGNFTPKSCNDEERFAALDVSGQLFDKLVFDDNERNTPVAYRTYHPLGMQLKGTGNQRNAMRKALDIIIKQTFGE